jgi:hypothetical protein
MLLADRVLAAQAVDEPIPKAHINALLDAAIILDKYEVELPAPLGQIVDQISDAEDEEAGRLAWLFRPFQEARTCFRAKAGDVARRILRLTEHLQERRSRSSRKKLRRPAEYA